MKTATAIHPFQAECSDELSLNLGDRVFVHEHQPSSAWLVVQRGKSRGLVPASYLEFDLAPGWARTIDDDGVTFYYNRDLGLTQYEYPLPNLVGATTTGGKDPTVVLSYSGGPVAWLHGDRLAFMATDSVVVKDNFDDLSRHSVLLHGQDRILSLARHPNGALFVTGDSANYITVWDPLTPLRPLTRFATDHRNLMERKHGEDNAIKSVDFCPAGVYLAVLLDKTIEIYKWAAEKNILVAKTRGRDSLGFTSLLFNPSEVEGQTIVLRKALVSLGPDQIKFWALSSSARIRDELIEDDSEVEDSLEGNTWSPQLKSQSAGAPTTLDSFTCMGFSARGAADDSYPLASVLTGTMNGKIWIWQQLVRRVERRLDLRIPKPFGRLIAVISDVHESPLSAIATSHVHLLTCGQDGVMSLWDWTDASPASALVTSSCPFIHSVSFCLPRSGVGFGQSIVLNPNGDGQVVAVVGTSTNSLLLISLAADLEAERKLVLKYLIKS